MSTEHPTVGKSAQQVDDELASDEDVAAMLDMAISNEQDQGHSPDLCEDDEEQNGLLRRLVDEVRSLKQQVSDQQTTIEEQSEQIEQLARRNNKLSARLKDIENESEETREIARSAVAKANQAAADSDQQEDAEALPTGTEPSSSPLDFLANCRELKVKNAYVETNRQNTYRAVKVAKRWKEFAKRRNDGEVVFWERDDIETALTAELGKSPHRQTISRVWDKLAELGGGDLVEKTPQVGREDSKKEILAMDIETAERLLENRYAGLDLLEDTIEKVSTGGVTPVVTEGAA
jgi:predicted RNase H-like nuclease (RuvC/YqgF family)